MDKGNDDKEERRNAMLKRKLAVLIALVLVAGLTLAACSSSSSSTNDALSYPGDNYLGTIRVDVDPGEESGVTSMTVTPVANAVDGPVFGDLTGVTVTTSNVEWEVAGPGTITGDMKLVWAGAERLEDVAIRVIDAGGGPDVVMDNDDVGGGCATLGTGVSSGDFCGIAYVAEKEADDAETEIEIDPNFPDTNRNSRYNRVMCPQCGQVTAPWSLTEASGAPYTFFANIFGTKISADVTADPRYDHDYATLKAITYKPEWALGNLPPIDQAVGVYHDVSPNEWFYVGLWWDAAGDSRAGTGLCTDGPKDADAICYGGPGDVVGDSDAHYLEDLDNLNAAAAALAWITFPSFYNTSFMFLYGGGWNVRWDPAVITTIDSYLAGKTAFKTAAGGTFFNAIVLDDPLNPYSAQMSPVAVQISPSFSNSMGVWQTTYSWSGGLTNPMPDGTSDYSATPDGVQGDIMFARLGLQAIGVSGEGTRLAFGASNQTNVWVGVGKYQNTQAGNWYHNNMKNPAYPAWDGAVGIGAASPASYNEQIGWVCIQ